MAFSSLNSSPSCLIIIDTFQTVAQLAIAWVLGHPGVSVALVGVRNERELQEDIRAVDWKLTDDVRSELDRIFQEEGVPTYVDASQAV